VSEASATVVAVAAPIAEVTVLEDRAQIRRRGAAAITGPTRIVVDGVAPALVDKTLLVTASGATVASTVCERYLAPWAEHELGAGGAPSDAEGGAHDANAGQRGRPSAVTGDQIVGLEAERRALATQIADAERAAAVAEAETAAVIELARAALAELADAAAWGDADPAAADRLAVLDRRDAAARRRAAALAVELDERRAELGRLDDRLAELRATAGRDAARLVIELAPTAGGAAATAELTIEYVVPGAAWRPYHRAQLDPAAGALALRTDACVWQATGEDWTGVGLIFSTERPSLGVEPPDLVDDVLAVRRRPDQVVVETRDQDIETAGLGRGGAVQDVPGIDDGGLGTRLRATAPATIAADGRPYRVLLAERTMPATSELVAMPERGPGVHLRAVATNPGPSPILAGPVDLVLAAGYVGRGVLGFIAAGEQVELGFGPDAELRVHREEDRDTEAGGLLSGWNETRVRVAVRISNLGAAPRRIKVTERVPISEVEQVKVELAAADAWQLEDEHGRREPITMVTARSVDDQGMATWMVELPPRERRAIALEYRIRAHKGVVGV
jgi:uncharacterized protein (TIGR02231 family)